MDDPLPCTSTKHEEVLEIRQEPFKDVIKEINMSPGAVKLRDWLNKTLRIEMSDGRILIGVFLCTDRDANLILGSSSEYLPGEIEESNSNNVEEPRMLGLVMVPGKHIVSISIDENDVHPEVT